MKALITGLNGTVAPFLARHLLHDGHQVVGWDRAAVSPDDPGAVSEFIRREQPDWLFHLAMGSPLWAEQIARVCRELGIALLYTSTVSVYSGRQTGPFHLSARPEPDNDYGRYKFECEHRVQSACPDAQVVRLGWQIGSTPGSNNMIDYLHRQSLDHGRIEASARWYPACSFLQDTAESLYGVIRLHPPGLYQLDGNPGLSFFDLASGLNALHGGPWKIVRTETPAFDNRMLDPRLEVTPITRRLPPPYRTEAND